MKRILGIDEALPVSGRSFKVVTKLKRELLTDIGMQLVPLMEPSSLVENNLVRIWEVSQNTDMGEILGINKALQSIQGELVNSTSTPKLTKIQKIIEKGTTKLKEHCSARET